MRAAWLPLLMLAPAAAFHAWLVRKPPRSGLDASSTSESPAGIFHYDMMLTPLVLNSESELVGASVFRVKGTLTVESSGRGDAGDVKGGRARPRWQNWARKLRRRLRLIFDWLSGL